MNVLLQKLVRLISSSAILKCGILLVIILALFGELKISILKSISNKTNCPVATVTNRVVGDDSSRGAYNTNVIAPNVIVNAHAHAIAPGELPGYTGWARPEKTLARSFSIKSISTTEHSPKVGTMEHEYVITVQCEGHKDCVKNNKENDIYDGASLFFLRAYGPAVLPGTVTTRSCSTNSDSSGGGCYYDITFVFYDPGLYTIEAVLTFSSPPPISAFPLNASQQPAYEGYLLPGFPLLVTVAQEREKEHPQVRRHETKSSLSISDKDKDEQLCKFEDLIETSPTSAMEKARWKVTGKVNEKEYSSKTMNSPVISKIGYMNNVNSLGIDMEYQYMNNCLLIPESAYDKNLYDQHAFSPAQCGGPQKKIHVIYIGDSVLRIQKKMFQDLLKGITTNQVELSFLSITDGYRKNQILGPSNVEQFLRDFQTKMKTSGSNNDVKVVILFNTGLHDIHRLCGAEFEDERPTYLEKDRLNSGSFACVDEYRALLRDFLDVIKEIPAELKVFQSTTAAWPKYGNFGVAWEKNPQRMPLVSDFNAVFNEIAFEVLADYKKDGIDIMDGYWITYPRPDNREFGDVGNKLSHPGIEVFSTMVRKWAMLVLDRVCQHS